LYIFKESSIQEFITILEKMEGDLISFVKE
jgi:hypothetical protein